ncbi:MAG TPA: zf-HC2 domain-containing protein [Steroidobacteraceae bacterium]
MRCAESLRVQAYFDGETDAVLSAEIERHIEECAECRTLLRDFGETREAIRREVRAEHAPAALRARVMGDLLRESAARSRTVRHRVGRSSGSAPSIWRTASGARSFWFGSLSGMAAAAALGAALWFSGMWFAPASDRLIDDLAAAHVRSLMASHLIDVSSTDQHTVKPWFAGQVDVSPVVADFAGQGYRLLGGRADYFDGHRSAVVVYQHGHHFINVFSWKAGAHALPKDSTRNGYRLVFWKAGDLEYCAVADAGSSELLALERLLRNDPGAEPTIP